MKYTIIADSSCDLFSKNLNSDRIDFYTVPLTIVLNDNETVDDQNLDTNQLVKAMKESHSAPKTACPSPESFYKIMKEHDNIICITISSKLSGTFNSARIAAENAKKDDPDKKIFVLDSLSASAGIVLILNKLKELIDKNDLTFEEIVNKITTVRNKTRVRFVLQDLGNLVKTGRLSKVMQLIVSVLSIKPIMGDNQNGEIIKISQHLGTKKALNVLADCPSQKVKEEGIDTPVVITHCHNVEDASFLKRLIETKFGLTNIKIILMRGLASFYANEKGLVLAY